MKESEREILLDILGNSERPDKIIVELHILSKDVVVTYEDLDDEWFKELKEARSSSEPDPYDGLIGIEAHDPKKRIARLELERKETISMLRQICERFGDNDWEDNLYLPDIIEKHLWRNLKSPN